MPLSITRGYLGRRVSAPCHHSATSRNPTMTKFSGRNVRRHAAGFGLLAGLATDPRWPRRRRGAAPDCSAAGVSNTVSFGDRFRQLSTWGNHPGAKRGCDSCEERAAWPGGDGSAQLLHRASAGVRRSCGASWHPIGDTQRQCNTTVLSPDLESALQRVHGRFSRTRRVSPRCSRSVLPTVFGTEP